MIWFTSDEHVDHPHVIRYDKRPFDSVEHMVDELVKRHNEVVHPRDLVYHLGDMAFKDGSHAQYVKRLNGQHFLIKGNHDPTTRMKKGKVQNPFQFIKDVHEIKYEIDGNKQRIWLSHYAHRVWPASHHGAWHLYGHSHGNADDWGMSMDVGVVTNDYYPWSLEQIALEMFKKNQKVIDHHRQGVDKP